MDYLVDDLLLLLGMNFFLYLVSLYLVNTYPVDFVWSMYPPFLIYLIYFRSIPVDPVIPRMLVVFPLIMVWGFRLTSNFLGRGGIGHEDWRYADMRVKFGKHFWWASLFTVFWGQTVFLWGPTLSLYGAIQSDLPWGALDWCGLVSSSAGILLETFGDMQMNNFINLKLQKKTGKVVLDTGLWALSRHPNYLGELLFWWGVYLFQVEYGPAWIVAGPLALTGLFFGVSVDLMETRQLENKHDAFVEYRRKVGSSILLLPPSLNRRIGELLYSNNNNE